MGMDVFGVKPTQHTGEHFRNNVWWWRQLWQYCYSVAPDLCADVSGHSNDGDGLDASGAMQLAAALRTELDSGRCAAAEQAYNAWKAELQREPCRWCDATGIRSDRVGIDMGMVEQVLEPTAQILLGRERGWCNGCGGEGLTDDWRAAYLFSTENVERFAAFLEHSGGFRIC